MKARLPLVSQRRSARSAGSEASSERLPVDRVLVCVMDEAAPDQALRFACAVIECARAHGRPGAALLRADALHAGAAQRLRALGASVSACAQPGLPGTAREALAALPHDTVVVALGTPFATGLRGLLTVRVGARRETLPVAEPDLEFAHDDGLLATLIGDWIVRNIPRLSAKDHAAVAKNSRA